MSVVTFKMCQAHNLKYGRDMKSEFKAQGYALKIEWIQQRECIYCKVENKEASK